MRISSGDAQSQKFVPSNGRVVPLNGATAGIDEREPLGLTAVRPVLR